jgi:hypothetical protein
MKNLRQFCSAVVFTLVLTFSAFAGDIQAPGVTAQPPPPPQSLSTGDLGDPGAVALDPLTEITLKMLESMLSIL